MELHQRRFKLHRRLWELNDDGGLGLGAQQQRLRELNGDDGLGLGAQWRRFGSSTVTAERAQQRRFGSSMMTAKRAQRQRFGSSTTMVWELNIDDLGA